MPGASALPAGRPSEGAAAAPQELSRAPQRSPRRLYLKTRTRRKGAAGFSCSGARGSGSLLVSPLFSGDRCSMHSAGKAAHASLLQSHLELMHVDLLPCLWLTHQSNCWLIQCRYHTIPGPRYNRSIYMAAVLK